MLLCARVLHSVYYHKEKSQTIIVGGSKNNDEELKTCELLDINN